MGEIVKERESCSGGRTTQLWIDHTDPKPNSNYAMDPFKSVTPTLRKWQLTLKVQLGWLKKKVTCLQANWVKAFFLLTSKHWSVSEISDSLPNIISFTRKGILYYTYIYLAEDKIITNMNFILQTQFGGSCFSSAFSASFSNCYPWFRTHAPTYLVAPLSSCLFLIESPEISQTHGDKCTVEPVCMCQAVSDSLWWGSCLRPDWVTDRPLLLRSSHGTWMKEETWYCMYMGNRRLD